MLKKNKNSLHRKTEKKKAKKQKQSGPEGELLFMSSGLDQRAIYLLEIGVRKPNDAFVMVAWQEETEV